MKRLLVIAIALLALSFMTASVAVGVDVLRIKTGLNYINPSLIHPGYPVFTSAWNGGTMVVIDNYGNLVHYWHTASIPANIQGITWPQIWRDGNLITAAGDTTHNSATIADPLAKGVGGDYDTLLELDWNSNVIWHGNDYFYKTNYASHHDFKKIWNKTLGAYTYIALTTNAYYKSDAVAQGADPQYDKASGGYANGWSPDGVVEVNQAGETIWRWTFGDHLVQNYDATKTANFTTVLGYPARGSTYGQPVDFPGKIDLNHLPDNLQGPCKDWTHCNSLDYHDALGHIVFNAKHTSEIYVVDHDATFVSGTDWQANFDAAQSDAGDFIYRFGNPANYGMGTSRGYRFEGNHQFWGAHNIQWIGEGNYDGFDVFGPLPGEGHMIIFDNGCWNPNGTVSVVVEWDPFRNAEGVNTGDYVDPPAAGYQTNGYSKQVTWTYEAGTGFYSFYISGQQRMPNGNTIICSGAQSHFFEVTADKQLAWEYFKPDISQGFGGATTGDYTVSAAGAGFGAPSTFRCNKIPVGHPALDGRDLTPKGNFRELVIDEKRTGAAMELKKFLGSF